MVLAMTMLAMTRVVAKVLARMVPSPGESSVQPLQEPCCHWAGLAVLAGPLRLYQLDVVVEGNPPPGLLLPALLPAAAPEDRRHRPRRVPGSEA